MRLMRFTALLLAVFGVGLMLAACGEDTQPAGPPIGTGGSTGGESPGGMGGGIGGGAGHATGGSGGSGLAPPAPNVVVVVADDQGWADFSANGTQIPTPNIDRIATEGARLRNFYVQPVCSPTRVGLLTGRYPLHFGLMRGVIRPWNNVGLPTASETLAERLAGEGYAFRGAIGKWHLGHTSYQQHHPLNHGFTSFYGTYIGALDYFSQERFGERAWHRNAQPSPDTGYITDLIADAAVAFVEQNAQSPFLLYLPFTAPHTPLQAPQALIDMFSSIPDLNRRTYAAMVTSLDINVGRVLDALESEGVLDSTVVWFLSDNGGYLAGGASNVPLAGEKNTLYEGGIRTFSAVRYPPAIAAATVVTEPAAYIDVVPTVLEAVGAAPPSGIDGVSLWAHLMGQGQPLDRRLYFYNQHSIQAVQEVQVAAIEWPFKFLRITQIMDGSQTRALYDLAADPSETTPVTGNPIAGQLEQAIDLFLAQSPGSIVDPSETLPMGFMPPTDWQMGP